MREASDGEATAAAPRPASCPHPPGDRMKRAKRDFSAAEFASALMRNGILPLASGMTFADGETGLVISAVLRTTPIRVARRATLAKILRARP